MAIRRILKYVILVDHVANDIDLPQGAQIVHVGYDPRGRPCIWVIERPNEPTGIRRFIAYGTGSDIHSETTTHLGTLVDNCYVWHVCEVKV